MVTCCSFRAPLRPGLHWRGGNRPKLHNFSYANNIAQVDVFRSTYHSVFTAVSQWLTLPSTLPTLLALVEYRSERESARSIYRVFTRCDKSTLAGSITSEVRVDMLLVSNTMQPTKLQTSLIDTHILESPVHSSPQVILHHEATQWLHWTTVGTALGIPDEQHRSPSSLLTI